MFTITFYRFSKKRNSTLRPSTGGTNYQCRALEPFDHLNPTFELRMGQTIPSYNYAATGGYYYWITKWECVGPNWRCYCTVDALASWRDTIGNQQIYVYRSSSSYNLRITDNMYPTLDRTHMLNVTLPKLWTVGGANAAGAAENTGVYIAGLIGSTGTRYYVFDAAHWSAFLQYIFSDSYYNQVLGQFGATEYPEAKVAINPVQYIASLWYAPIGILTGGGAWGIRVGDAVQFIPLGNTMIPHADISNQRAYPIDDFATSFSIYDIAITEDFGHPQASERGDWLNLAPYTQIQLFYPPFGLVELDPAAISHHENMRLRVTLDARTAEIMLEVQVYNVPADMRTIYRATSSFGVPVPVSNVITPGYSDLRATQSILGGLASLAQGNIGAAVDKFGAAIGGAVEGSIPHVSSIGGPGSTAKLDGFPKLYVTHWRVSPDDLQGKGRPLCDMRTISTIPGYIQGDPDELEIPCTSTELEIIREHVRNGFHYQ